MVKVKGIKTLKASDLPAFVVMNRVRKVGNSNSGAFTFVLEGSITVCNDEELHQRWEQWSDRVQNGDYVFLS